MESKEDMWLKQDGESILLFIINYVEGWKKENREGTVQSSEGIK